MQQTTVLVLMLLVAAFAAPLATNGAQKDKRDNPRKNDERRENEAVRKARQGLKDAQEAANTAERALRRAVDQSKAAELSLLQAISQLQATREDLDRTHAEATGLLAARTAAESARQAYVAAGQPVLRRLRESPQYQAAATAAMAADQKLSSQRNDSEGNADERLKQLADAAKIKQVPAQLERAALDVEPGLAAERTRLTTAEDAVALARRQVDRAIEKDPRLKAANDKVEQATKAAAAARRAVSQEQRQLADARKKLASEQQDLLRKIAADNRDDNKPNKGKK